MGRRGPARTPAAILKMRGSTLAASRNDDQIAAVKRPECPDWVEESARPIFNAWADELLSMRVIAAVDATALGLAANAMAEYVRASEQIKLEGHVIRSSEGGAYQHPAVSIRNRAHDAVMKILSDMGCSPAARTRLTPVVEREAGGKALGAFARSRRKA